MPLPIKRVCIWSIKRNLVILFLFYFNLADAHTHIQHLDETSGMASGIIYCGLQDETGYIWLGTENGLHRYDGHQFIVFNKENNQLRENKIIRLVRQGNLMYILYGIDALKFKSAYKVDVFNLDTYEIFPLQSIFPESEISEKEIEWIAAGRSEEIFVLLTDQTILIKPKQDKITNWYDPVERLKTSTQGHISHIFSNKVAGLYDQDLDRFRYITMDTTFQLPDENPFHWHFVYKNQELVLINTRANTGEFQIWNPSRKYNLYFDKIKASLTSSRPLTFLNDPISQSSIIINHQKALLELTENGFTLLANEDQIITDDDYINSFFKDRDGKIWLCTSRGLYIIDYREQIFNNFLSSWPPELAKLENQVRGLTAINNKLYIGSWRDLAIINTHSNDISKINKGDSEIVYAVQRIGDHIYFGTSSLFRLTPEDQPVNLYSVSGTPIWCIFEYSSTKLLLGLNEEILLFDLDSLTARPLHFQASEFPNPSFIYKIVKDKEDFIWAISETGLYQFNPDLTPVAHFGTELFGTKLLYDLYIDESNIFWIATNDHGLLKWNPSAQILESVNIQSGLSSNTIYRIEEDELGRIWVSSKHGLNCIQKENLEVVRIFTTSHGLPFNEFNRISSYKDDKGWLYFGGLNGMISFNPENFHFQYDFFSQSLRISRIRIFSAKENQWKDHYLSNAGNKYEIEINPSEGPVTVEVTMLDFESGDYRYYFKMHGLENEWILVEKNIIRINRLPYGEHVIQIRGVNPSGIHSIDHIALLINADYPIYLTWWFILGLIITIIGLATFLSNIRFSMIRQKNENLEILVDSKTRDLKKALEMKGILMKELEHRVKNYLYIIDSILELQKEEIPNKKLATILEQSQKRIKSIFLMHQNLSFSEGVDLVNLNQFLYDLIHQFDEFISLQHVTIQPVIELNQPVIRSEKAMPIGLIINEWLTNSFKHGFNKKNSLQIEIKVFEKGNHIFIHYIDNGSPSKNEKTYHSNSVFGLNLIESLVKQIDGTLEYNLENGANFLLKVPS